MPLRTRIFILITLVVLVVLGISLLLVVKSSNKPATTPPGNKSSAGLNQGNVIIPGSPATVIPPNVVVMPVDSAAVTENTVRQLAKIFVERFNTYSSDNIYQNIRDVQAIAADDYWKKISLPLSHPTLPPAAFVALTTRVIAITSSNVQNTMALVILKAKKSSTNGAVSTESYVDYNVSLVKFGERWLVANQVENR